MHETTAKMAAHPRVESIASSVSGVSSEVEPENKPIHLSIRLIGDRGVGKVSIVDRYLERQPTAKEKLTAVNAESNTDTTVDQSKHL